MTLVLLYCCRLDGAKSVDDRTNEPEHGRPIASQAGCDRPRAGMGARRVIRVTASIVHKSGTEILRHDSLPIARAALWGAIEEALAFVCDGEGHAVEQGGAAIVLRIEPVTCTPASQ